MIQIFGRNGGSALLLLVVAGLLSACATGDDPSPSAADRAAAISGPGTVSAHIDGSESFFMGVSGSH